MSRGKGDRGFRAIPSLPWRWRRRSWWARCSWSWRSGRRAARVRAQELESQIDAALREATACTPNASSPPSPNSATTPPRRRARPGRSPLWIVAAAGSRTEASGGMGPTARGAGGDSGQHQDSRPHFPPAQVANSTQKTAGSPRRVASARSVGGVGRRARAGMEGPESRSRIVAPAAPTKGRRPRSSASVVGRRFLGRRIPGPCPSATTPLIPPHRRPSRPHWQRDVKHPGRKGPAG